MKVHDFLVGNTIDLHKISEQCNQFIGDALGEPLCKRLPQTYNDIHKVKVRLRRKSNVPEVSNVFNRAFIHEGYNLHQRVVIGSNNPPIEENTDLFYIFPIDGYQYMYCRESTSSTESYKKTLDVLIEQVGIEQATTIVSDLLKFTYCTDVLHEGIQSGAEIIVYNIPYFYAVRASLFNSYSDLLNKLAG